MTLTYVTWDGPGARYLRSLYLPVFSHLNTQVTVIQATYGEAEEVEATRAAAQRMGVGYEPILFSRDQSLARTLLYGGGRLGAAVLSRSFRRDEVIMARSLVPAAMCMASGVPSRRFVFDADGLVADERVEFAGWNPAGMPYRASRAVERRALRHANVSLTRTVAARDILVERGGVSPRRVLVAGNGSDVNRFQPLGEERRREGRRALGISDSDCLVVYCGSIGPQYHPKLMATFVKALRRTRAPGAVHFLVLSAAEEQAKALLADAGCDTTTGHHRVLAPNDVPTHIGLADIGLALREPSLSQRAVAPIKVGEYLLCGVPVLANTGVGDLDTQLGPNDSLLVSRLDADHVRAAALRFSTIGFDAVLVRSVGLQHFSLDAMVRGYQAAYDFVKTKG